MSVRLQIRVLGVAAALATGLAACSGAVFGPDAEAPATVLHTDGDTILLAGAFEGNVVSLELLENPPTAIVDFEGTGRATGLGPFAVRYPHQVDLITQVEEGTAVLTATNGDQVHMHFVVQLVAVDPVTFTGSGPATITGGTGRFAGANGQVHTEGVVNLETGFGRIWFAGRISVPDDDDDDDDDD